MLEMHEQHAFNFLDPSSWKRNSGVITFCFPKAMGEICQFWYDKLKTSCHSMTSRTDFTTFGDAASRNPKPASVNWEKDDW
jgi:hypothetical protein